MFTKHYGGDFVSKGFYWSRSSWEFVSISEEGGTLMGEQDEWYLRAPLPVVLVLGPLMGLLFFFTLPFSGMVVLAPFLAGKLRTAFETGGLSPAHVARPTQPGISNLEPRLRGAASRRAQRTEDENGKLVDLADRIARENRQENEQK